MTGLSPPKQCWMHPLYDSDLQKHGHSSSQTLHFPDSGLINKLRFKLLGPAIFFGILSQSALLCHTACTPQQLFAWQIMQGYSIFDMKSSQNFSMSLTEHNHTFLVCPQVQQGFCASCQCLHNIIPPERKHCKRPQRH